jgi:alcohol dehydrogenase
VVDVSVDDPVAALRKAAGGFADVVVDVTAKAPSALGNAVDLARPGGTIVLAGVRGEGDLPGFKPDHVVLKELRILGALGVDVAEYSAALDLVASGAYPFASVPREVVGLDGAPNLLATMAGETENVPPVHGVVQP